MTAAIIGLIGALVGLVVGRTVAFWSTRRAELAAAVAAMTAIGEQLRAGTRASLLSAWQDHRDALVILFAPEDLRHLAEVVYAADAADTEATRLLAMVDQLTELLWQEHQAFILAPLLHYLRRDTLSKRLRAAIRSCLGAREVQRSMSARPRDAGSSGHRPAR